MSRSLARTFKPQMPDDLAATAVAVPFALGGDWRAGLVLALTIAVIGRLRVFISQGDG